MKMKWMAGCDCHVLKLIEFDYLPANFTVATFYNWTDSTVQAVPFIVASGYLREQIIF